MTAYYNDSDTKMARVDSQQFRALDLFCGAGGATKGLQQAGFHVTGVDIKRQPRYCGDVFIQADALSVDLEGYDFIWASPPCQGYSRALQHLAKPAAKLIESTRLALLAHGRPYVIENVVGAPLKDPIRLCGTMFDLPLYRHRLFEASFKLLNPVHFKHTLRASRAGHYESGTIVSVAGHCAPIQKCREAMGIDWMNREELAEAIPPAYSKFIGRQFFKLVDGLEDRMNNSQKQLEIANNSPHTAAEVNHERVAGTAG